MAAQRRMQTAPATPVDARATRPAPVAAASAVDGHAGPAAASPVHAQMRRLEASFAEPDVALPRYPLAVRLAIMGGAPLALWAVLILGVAATVRAIGA